MALRRKPILLAAQRVRRPLRCPISKAPFATVVKRLRNPAFSRTWANSLKQESIWLCTTAFPPAFPVEAGSSGWRSRKSARECGQEDLRSYARRLKAARRNLSPGDGGRRNRWSFLRRFPAHGDAAASARSLGAKRQAVSVDLVKWAAIVEAGTRSILPAMTGKSEDWEQISLVR
jgi:hypothetical protein